MPDIALRRQLVLSSLQEAQALEENIRVSAAAACLALAELVAEDQALDVLRAVKFRKVGFDPLDASRPLNLVEQVHQTFTYLTSLRGVEYLLEKHPGHAPYHLNLGTTSGPDIYSADLQVVAEAFAAVTPRNNNKLKADIKRMRASTAPLRYVFYYAEVDLGTVTDPEIRVVSVSL